MNKTLRIAAIPGDGIGKEVLPEGVRVLQAAAERWGLALSFEYFEWASLMRRAINAAIPAR